MIDLFYMQEMPVAVMGLGKSGLATARALRDSGAEVRVWDDNPASRAAAEAEGFAVVMDGFNQDDKGDYRPGHQAAREHATASPLAEAGLGKAEVRAVAKQLGLEVWDKPAAACLSSRIPYGTPVTTEALARIDAAEVVLAGLGFRGARVRHHDQLARVATTSQAGLQASWEVDLFGANRAAKTAADERLAGAQALWHEARVSVAAEVAQQTSSIRTCLAQQQVAERDAQSRSETSRLSQLSERAGFTAPATAAPPRWPRRSSPRTRRCSPSFPASMRPTRPTTASSPPSSASGRCAGWNRTA